MAVAISNFAVRQIIGDENGNLTFSDWNTEDDSVLTGFRDTSYRYVAQFRFRFSKPCASFTFQLYSYYSYYGTSYWKVSPKEQDDVLINSGIVPGAPYDVVVKHTNVKQIKTVTFVGPFKADTDYYLYGFHYSESSWTLSEFFAFYDYNDELTSKIIEVVEIDAIVHIGNGLSSDAYELYIYNGSIWDQYQSFTKNDEGWDEHG